MKILLDMNLSPDLVAGFAAKSVNATHWSSVGDPRASDHELMRYASSHGFVLITHDLDFGALLAATNAERPSVLQVRSQNLLSDSFVDVIVNSLNRYKTEVENGCLITIEPAKARLRLLPFR